MSVNADGIATLDDLKEFVREVLCARENLLREQFELTTIPVTRNGRNCGLQYSLKGPRGVRLGAIWAADHNLVYFYDARGERFQKVQIPRRLTDKAA